MEYSFNLGGGVWGACPQGVVLCLWYFVLVHLSTCLPGLTGQEVNRGVQGIMGIPYLFTCRPVNLSTRVDRLIGKFRSAGHYGYFVLVHLSTCLLGLTGHYGSSVLVLLLTCQPVCQGGQVQM